MARRTYTHESPEPLEGNDIAVVIVGTAVWLALFLVQLPFLGWLRDHDRVWWLWTCLSGAGLGVVGYWYVRRREAAQARGDRTGAERPAEPAGPEA